MYNVDSFEILSYIMHVNSSCINTVPLWIPIFALSGPPCLNKVSSPSASCEELAVPLTYLLTFLNVLYENNETQNLLVCQQIQRF